MSKIYEIYSHNEIDTVANHNDEIFYYNKKLTEKQIANDMSEKDITEVLDTIKSNADAADRANRMAKKYLGIEDYDPIKSQKVNIEMPIGIEELPRIEAVTM